LAALLISDIPVFSAKSLTCPLSTFGLLLDGLLLDGLLLDGLLLVDEVGLFIIIGAEVGLFIIIGAGVVGCFTVSLAALAIFIDFSLTGPVSGRAGDFVTLIDVCS